MNADHARKQVLGLAGAALLSALLGCSSNPKDAPVAAGMGGEPNEVGGTGPRPAGGSAGSSSGGSETGGGDATAAGGDATGVGGTDAGAGGAAAPEILQTPAYASSVESFDPGAGAGFNQAKLPGIVLGPPKGKGSGSGSLDVVSLGAGGEIVLGFGDLHIVDGPGPDFVVFENAFWPGGDPTQVFAELGEVSVSEDGQSWQTFPCDSAGDGHGNFNGCAGVTPTLVYDASQLVPLDPKQSGGDAFDLAELGLQRVRFVKIHDLETQPPGGTTTGFDLDAVGAIHAK